MCFVQWLSQLMRQIYIDLCNVLHRAFIPPVCRIVGMFVGGSSGRWCYICIYIGVRSAVCLI